MAEDEVELDDVEHHLLEDAAPAEEDEDDDMIEVDEEDDEDDEEDEEEEDDDDYEADDKAAVAARRKAEGRNVAAVAERRRLRELQRLKKVELERLREEQNAEVQKEAEGGTGSRTKLRFLLQQTELFGKLMNSERAQALEEKKRRGRKGAGGKKRSSAEMRRIHDLDEDDEDDYIADGDADVGITKQTFITEQPSIIKFGKLRKYQMEGLNWLVQCYDRGINGILADEMGLGKTLQTISLIAYLRESRGITGPHLVIGPKSTLGNWMNEFKRWCPVVRAMKFHGDAAERARLKEEELVPGGFDACVTSYEMIIKEKTAFRKFSWRYIIIDEAHRIKNENSILSQTVRLFHSNYRLLITGTPLQNNLHELWALLNFLLPEVFRNADDFDELFQVDGDEEGKGDGNQAVVQQLHKVLRPFLLRRLKKEVEKTLPPKKEIILKAPRSEIQSKFYRSIMQKDFEVVNGGGDRSRLLNIIMQLRKCSNHPYLFQGAEPGPPYTTGEHLIEASGKLVLLDKLLKKLKAKGSRVLIFSQMTRVLDILEDYMHYRGHKYCRIDGNTVGEDRDMQIEAFNGENSEKFAFLLSTRAGGLGINLATADIVVLYDSDWNPQMDLQAMDRAHRIGQQKEVLVFRLMTENTIEEKIIEKAYKKLAIDALVIQQGRLTESKVQVSKEELLQMVRYGADKIFDSSGGPITDEDIDLLIAKGAQEHDNLNAKLQEYTRDALQFSMDGSSDLYDFDENLAKKEENNTKLPDGLKAMVAATWVDPPKRERKRNYSEAEYYRNALRVSGGPAKPREPRLPKLPALNDYQFYDTQRLNELFEKETKHLQFKAEKMKEKAKEEKAKEESSVPTGKPPEEESAEDYNEAPPLTEDEIEERESLLSEGFSTWSRKDFLAFVRACERFGRDEYGEIAREVGKPEDEIADYSIVFWKRGPNELHDWERISKNIEKGEAKIQRKVEIADMLRMKMSSVGNPWRDLKIVYGQNRGKAYTEEEDRFLLCMLHQIGYGNWDELKLEIRRSWMMRFDWFLKSRTPAELARRCETLIRLIEKEFGAEDAEENGSVVKKRKTQGTTPATPASADKKKRAKTRG